LWEMGYKYAIVIGVSDYKIDKYDLTAAANDALSVAQVLEDKKLAGYAKVIEILDKAATRQNILREMETIARKAGPNDTVLIFYSGHGFTSGKKAYLLPYNGESEFPETTSIDLQTVVEILKGMDAKQKLLILDCCHSGAAETMLALARGDGKRNVDIKDETLKTLTGEGLYIITSCREGEFSYEAKGQGFFTKHLVAGLMGEADKNKAAGGNSDGYVSATEVSAYAHYKTNKDVEDSLGKSQHPRSMGAVEGVIYLTNPGTGGMDGSPASSPKLIASITPFPEEDEGYVLPITSPKIINEIGMIMVYVPAGEFEQGSNQGADDENPMQKTYLNDYYIGKYEVTFGQYKNFLEKTGYRALPDWVSKYSITDEHPVVGVSWQDAVAFCKWLSQVSGKNYYLPTESEWEKAAKGTGTREYPWGNQEPDDSGVYRANYNPGKFIEDGYEFTSKTGNFMDGVSPYGCWNMAGNAWEWCADWYDEKYCQQQELTNNPKGADTGTKRIVRGGSWSSQKQNLRVSNRHCFLPESQLNIVGFRCCCGQ
ncbi:MAG: SUMF1/EgtB/PvdO family nonheme iron enzyme, partial [Candidatus Desantisbacteria bacterium]